MKLVGLYIENFGGLSQYELHFSDELTAINEPNGFGKTTLAEFIRAMFYGFPRKVKTLEKSKRQKYAPWNGGQYGGNLVFEHDGQCYRIERTFGITPKTDTFTLIDLSTNRKSNRFTEEIGVQLFGLDSDSFERSAYVPQIQSDGAFSTSSIQAKLSNLVEDSSDVGNYDHAMGQLRAQRSALLPYRGSGGALAAANSKIAQLQLQLDLALEQQQQLQKAELKAQHTLELLQRNQASLEQISSELEQTSEMAAVAAQQQHYDQLQQRYCAAKEEAAIYTSQFQGSQPDWKWCRDQCIAYENLQSKIQNLEQYSSQLLQADRQMRNMQTEKAHTGMLVGGIVSLIAAVCALAAGAVFLISGEIPFSVAILTGSIVLLALGISLLIVRHKKHRAQAQMRQLQCSAMDSSISAAGQELQNLRNHAVKSADSIGAYLKKYGIEMPPQHFLAGLTRLEHDYQAWTQAQNTIRELEIQIAALEEKWGDSLNAELCAFQDPTALRQQEYQLRRDIIQLNDAHQQQLHEIRHLRKQTEVIPQLEDELKVLQRKVKKMRENVQTLDETMHFLEQAREKLSTNYLRTIESRFGYYLTQLESNSRESFIIDSDLNIQLERMGKIRELAYFSAGQADLVMLCMRLALVDALFRDESIFIILDDPFINLDNAHLAQAQKLLQNLKKERQIIYLTCHSSRMI